MKDEKKKKETLEMIQVLVIHVCNSMISSVPPERDYTKKGETGKSNDYVDGWNKAIRAVKVIQTSSKDMIVAGAEAILQD